MVLDYSLEMDTMVSRQEGRLSGRLAISAVQLVDFLPSMHTALGSFPSKILWYTPVILVLGR